MPAGAQAGCAGQLATFSSRVILSWTSLADMSRRASAFAAAFAATLLECTEATDDECTVACSPFCACRWRQDGTTAIARNFDVMSGIVAECDGVFSRVLAAPVAQIHSSRGPQGLARCAASPCVATQ